MNGCVGISVTLGSGHTVTWKVRVLQMVADLPAKAQLLNQLQFNGTYGCSVSYLACMLLFYNEYVIPCLEM